MPPQSAICRGHLRRRPSRRCASAGKRELAMEAECPRLTKHIQVADPIAHEPARRSELAKSCDHRHHMTCRERYDLMPPAVEERITLDDEGLGVFLDERYEGVANVTFGAGVQGKDLPLDSGGPSLEVFRIGRDK